MSAAFVIFLQTQGSPKDLSDALDRVGLRSEGFSDPRSFLKRLKEGSPMACVVDVGFEDSAVMLAMIKSIRSVLGAKLPVLALVQANDKATGEKAIASGATDVIHKPFDEDELLAVIAKNVTSPEADVIDVPKLVKWFFEKMSPAMAGLSGSLCENSELELQVQFYEERLKPYRDYFIAMISSMRKTETKAELTQCIRMYGIRSTRNLVVAMRLSTVTATPLVGWNAKTGMLAGDPGQALKFATKTVEHFGEGSRNQTEAFNSGLVLDLLSVMAEATGGRKAAVRKYIEERYIEALRQADNCIAAGKNAQSLVLERHIVTTILMREAGKIAMAIFYPDYLELRRKLEKKFLPPTLQHIVELRYFSVSHNMMGALIAQGAPGLGDAYKAVLFYDYPYMLKNSPDVSDTFDLLNVCSTI